MSLPFQRVLCITPTRSGLQPLTRRCIDALCDLGAARLELAGTSDIALARNLLLTRAREAPEHRDVFMLIDDDMSFSAAQAELLVQECLERDAPVSAVYATNASCLAATRRADGTWLTGLGFMALTRGCLQKYADELVSVVGINNERFLPFCQTGPHYEDEGGVWLSEDYWFCRALGGVQLLPFSVAHLKRMPITADLETIDRIFAVKDEAAE